MPAWAGEGDPTADLPFAHGGPVLQGVLRNEADDFVVEEELGYDASGAGEHVLLTIRKRGHNTQDLARTLARLAGVQRVAVGFAGLKDRNAVTTQHFTVQLAGRDEPDWKQLDAEPGIELLAARRHHRKIRRGGLRGNRFVVRVVGVGGDRAATEAVLGRIRHEGVPNYFGSQRFGRSGSNLARVDGLLADLRRRMGREQRGILLSAARSHLFNRVLAARVADGSWGAALEGDVMLLARSHGQFRVDPADATLGDRVRALEVHASGPLSGRPSRALEPLGEALRREQAALDDCAEWIAGLQRAGLDADRRALRLAVDDLEWEWTDEALRLSFRLAAGGYATAVLRELVRAVD